MGSSLDPSFGLKPSYPILSDPQVLWMLYFVESSNRIVQYTIIPDLYFLMQLSDNSRQCFYESFFHVAYKFTSGQSNIQQQQPSR